MKIKLFMLLMLMSGFAGISYEILYGRMLGNLIGDQFAVSASILITFLFGIGIGSRLAWRLWSWLWLIELLIGLFAAAFALGTEALEMLLYGGLPLLPTGLAGSVIASIVLLLFPSFLIGCSVPLFAGYMGQLSQGSIFSKVYAIYNLGAALTAILIEYLLLRWFGIEGTVFCFASFNLLIALVLRMLFVLPPPSQLRVEQPMTAPPSFWVKLIPIAMASALFQLLMVKLAEMLLGPFRESFALVLSLVLMGIALGSILVRRYKIQFDVIAMLALVSTVIFIISFEPVAYLYASSYEVVSESYLSGVLLKWGCLLLLMGLPVVAFGATVPALLNESSDQVSRESGQLLFVASLANVVGFLLMVFVLHRYLDYGLIILVIAALCALSLLIASQFKRSSAIFAGLLMMSSGVLYAQYWDEDLLYVSYTNFRSVDRLNQARSSSSMAERFKGYQDVFAINWVDGIPYFFINGYNSIPLNNPSEKIVGALSSIYASNLDHALVLGLGSGATASVVGQLFKQTDVVEINPVVRENLFRMKQWNFDIESNARVQIVVDDAMHYTKMVKKQYDLILNTVTTPLYFSSSKLYTDGFLNVVKQRLHPDGIYVTWMDARVGDRGVDIILNTIGNRFKHSALLYIKSSYFLLICSDEPIRASELPALKAGHVVYDHLLKHDGIVPEWLKYQLLTDDVLKLVSDQVVPINSADYPALEFEMARLSGRGIPAFKERVYTAMDLERVKRAVGERGRQYPATLAWHTNIYLKESSISERWSTLAGQYRRDFDHAYHQVQDDYFERLISAESDASAFHQFGYRLMQEGEYKRALTVFQHVLSLNERYNNAYFNMAACYEYLGDLSSALDYYQREKDVDPDDEDVSYRTGRVLVKMNRYGEAVDGFGEAIRVMGENVTPNVYYYLSQAYAELGQAEAARAAYQKADAMKQKLIR